LKFLPSIKFLYCKIYVIKSFQILSILSDDQKSICDYWDSKNDSFNNVRLTNLAALAISLQHFSVLTVLWNRYLTQFPIRFLVTPPLRLREWNKDFLRTWTYLSRILSLTTKRAARTSPCQQRQFQKVYIRRLNIVYKEKRKYDHAPLQQPWTHRRRSILRRPIAGIPGTPSQPETIGRVTKRERPIIIVIKGLPRNTNVEGIKEDILDQGFVSEKVT
ncbi:hypothetical protein TNIN_420691, partial [Trichonephila inaurata madagascariensis]